MNRIVGVDSGTVWIGDPCYFMKGKEWDSFCDTIEHGAGIKNIKYDLGHNRKGVLLDNFGGDGTYGVTIKKNKRGLVTKAIIDFTNCIDDLDMEKDIKATAKKNKLLPLPAIIDNSETNSDNDNDSDENPQQMKKKRSIIKIKNGYFM